MNRAQLKRRIWRPGGSPLLVLAGVALVIVAFGIAMDNSSYDIWGVFWVGPVLLALTVPIANSAVRRTNDPKLGRLILIVFGVKVIWGSVTRYILVAGIYGGGKDADRYDRIGKVVAPLFRDGVYRDLGKIGGTRFIELFTGQIYAIIGPSQLGGFLVYSWLAFVGVLLLCRAFEIAVPDGDHRRYRLLLLFFPTMIFWPTGIGKDVWIIFCLGGAAYGVAKLLDGRLIGLLPAGLGLWGMVIVRPHIALLFVVSATIAALTRSISPRVPTVGRARRWQGLLAAVVLVAGVTLVLSQAEQFFSIDKLNPESAESVLSGVAERTGTGGSEFDSPDPSTPLGLVLAVVTVLFRPFPWEAANGQAVLSALEGLVLLGFVWRALGRLSRLPSFAIRRPYVLGAALYVIAFCYAFSAIDNFGILARQRAQLLPFLFVLLALPTKPKAIQLKTDASVQRDQREQRDERDQRDGQPTA